MVELAVRVVIVPGLALAQEFASALASESAVLAFALALVQKPVSVPRAAQLKLVIVQPE